MSIKIVQQDGSTKDLSVAGGGGGISEDNIVTSIDETDLEGKVIGAETLPQLATKDEIAEMKSNFQDGCSTIASAITAKGVETASNATPTQMAENISSVYDEGVDSVTISSITGGDPASAPYSLGLDVTVTASNGKTKTERLSVEGTLAYNDGAKSVTPVADKTALGYSDSVDVLNPYDSTKKITITSPADRYNDVTLSGSASNVLSGTSITASNGKKVDGSMRNCTSDTTIKLTSSDARPVYAVDAQTSGDASYWVLNNSDGVNRICVKLNQCRNGYYPGSIVGLKTSLLGTTTASKSWSGATCNFSASAGYNGSAVTSSTTLGTSKSWGGATLTIYATADGANRNYTTTTLSTSGSWSGATYTHYAVADSANRASNSTTISTISASTITPSTSSQTAVSSGTRAYFSGAVTVGAIPSPFLRCARGSFTTSSAASGSVSITCGFQPKYVICYTYKNSNTMRAAMYHNGTTYAVASASKSGSVSTNSYLTITSTGFSAQNTSSTYASATTYYIACE